VITDDPRFVRGLEFFNAGEYFEASEEFEDLFFEGVRDEPDFIRIFLQFSVGIHHVQTGQRRPAIERIEEGLKIVAQHDYGLDLVALFEEMRRGLDAFRARRPAAWPKVRKRE
jgi:hypothetical protein